MKTEISLARRLLGHARARASAAGALILVVVVVVGLYWPSLNAPTFFDDANYFEHGLIYTIFLQGFVFEPRWLPYFLSAWVDLFFDGNLAAQRIVNIGLHLLTAFVLYALVKQISNHAAPHRNNVRAALAAALLFLLHPLAVYAVGYLVQRTILMATLFGLLTLSTYFDGLVSRKKAYFFFAALFYLLSSFSKEHAVLIPAAALALTPLAAPITRQTLRQLLLPFTLFLGVAILVVVRSQGNLARVYEPFAAQMASVQPNESPAVVWMLSVMTQASLFFKYILLILVPNPAWMSIDMRVPLAEHVWQPKYLLGGLALLAYGAAALLLLRKGGRRGVVGFALLAPLLLYAVEFSTVRIQEPFVLYRAYLWMPLLFLLLPPLTSVIPGKLFWPLALAVALAFAAASHDRLQSFSSEFALWDDAVRKLPAETAPGAGRVYNNRGVMNMRLGNFQAAVEDFTRSIQVSPAYKNAYENRAIIHMRLGQHQLAIQDVEALNRLDPQDLSTVSLRGTIYQSAGQGDKAMADFEFACQRKLLAACFKLELAKAKAAGGPAHH